MSTFFLIAASMLLPWRRFSLIKISLIMTLILVIVRKVSFTITFGEKDEWKIMAVLYIVQPIV